MIKSFNFGNGTQNWIHPNDGIRTLEQRESILSAVDQVERYGDWRTKRISRHSWTDRNGDYLKPTRWSLSGQGLNLTEVKTKDNADRIWVKPKHHKSLLTTTSKQNHAMKLVNKIMRRKQKIKIRCKLFKGRMVDGAIHWKNYLQVDVSVGPVALIRLDSVQIHVQSSIWGYYRSH